MYALETLDNYERPLMPSPQSAHDALIHSKPDSTLPAHSLNVKCLTYNEEGQFGSLVCTNVLYEAGNWIPIVTNADNWLYSHMISGDIT